MRAKKHAAVHCLRFKDHDWSGTEPVQLSKKNFVTDSQLLSTWLARREETAFRALVERHGRFVHSVASRACQDEAQAADVSQLVFILLAQKAGSLTSRTSIAGWMHLTTVRQAQNVLAKSRREARKLQHFQTHMETPHTPDPTASWQEIRPQLD